jgi:hypothetical protein
VAGEDAKFADNNARTEAFASSLFQIEKATAKPE